MGEKLRYKTAFRGVRYGFERPGPGYIIFETKVYFFESGDHESKTESVIGIDGPGCYFFGVCGALLPCLHGPLERIRQAGCVGGSGVWPHRVAVSGDRFLAGDNISCGISDNRYDNHDQMEKGLIFIKNACPEQL